MRNSTTSIELQGVPLPTSLRRESHSSHLDQYGISDAESVQQQLEPADRGLAAWRLLAVAFVFEALLWGTIRFNLLLFRLEITPHYSHY